MRAEKAAEKTRSRGWRIAIRAATRKVLSPISENIIIVKESTKEWKGWITPPTSPSVGMSLPIFFGGVVSSGSPLTTDGGTGCGISCGVSGRSVGFCCFISDETLWMASVATHLQPLRTKHTGLCFRLTIVFLLQILLFSMWQGRSLLGRRWDVLLGLSGLVFMCQPFLFLCSDSTLGASITLRGWSVGIVHDAIVLFPKLCPILLGHLWIGGETRTWPQFLDAPRALLRCHRLIVHIGALVRFSVEAIDGSIFGAFGCRRRCLVRIGELGSGCAREWLVVDCHYLCGDGVERGKEEEKECHSWLS